MKRFAVTLCALVSISIACGLVSTPPEVQAPGVATIVSETMEAFPTEEAPAFEGKAVAFQGGNLTIPPGLAAGVSQTLYPPASEPDVPPWEVTPGHIGLALDGYALQGTFHSPEIYIYPAQKDPSPPGLSEDVNRLKDLLADPGQPLGESNLPSVPFFNAGAVFTAQEELIQFQNGAGVRMVTQYAQSMAKVNNHELFYHFQGISNDGSAYIIAILPVSAATLPADSSDASPLPAGGVPFPGYADPNADFQAYYTAVREDLNRLPGDAFNPDLTVLDALIASLQVSAP